MSTTTTTQGRVLSFATGAPFVPAIGTTVDTRAPEWQTAGSTARLTPGLYRIEAHTISAEPHKRTGKVSPNAGQTTVRMIPADNITALQGRVVTARNALARAQAALTEAEAALAAAMAAPVQAAPVVTQAAPAAPAAPDPAALIAALPAEALMAALMAALSPAAQA